MQASASPAGFPKLIYKHIQSLQVQSMWHCVWCHGRSHRTMHGVTDTVVAPRIVSKALLSHHTWYCRHYYCVAMVGIMLQLHLLYGHGGYCCAMLCYGHDGCVTPQGVAVAVVVLHGGVIVTGIAPCVVSQASHHVWCHGCHGHHTMWCHSDYCCTAWCCSHDHCHCGHHCHHQVMVLCSSGFSSKSLC